MPKDRIVPAVDPIDDEVEQVLAALRQLAEQTESPVVRECLDSAAEEIAYLTCHDEPAAEPHDLEEDEAA